MTTLVYDTGALLAAESNDRRVWTMHNEALAVDRYPIVPTPVLAQAWRGGPQPLLSRLLKHCVIEALDEDTAREAGRTCRMARSSDVVDATVIVIAVRCGAEVVSSDRDDMDMLSSAIGHPIVVRPV